MHVNNIVIIQLNPHKNNNNYNKVNDDIDILNIHYINKNYIL